MTTYSVPEFNTFITLLGCMCATVQLATGYYASIRKKKIALLKINDTLHRSHTSFGSFATTLYFLGLFAGLAGFFGALLDIPNAPPLELNDGSFNVHTWPSFPIIIVVVWKTYISYFKKKSIYRKGKWLGIATFIAWAYTWVTSAISYYLRVEGSWFPALWQHDPPIILLPFDVFWLQILLPFILGILISWPIVKSAKAIEMKELTKSKKK